MNELIRMMNAFAVRMGILIFIFPEAIYENNLKFEIGWNNFYLFFCKM